MIPMVFLFVFVVFIVLVALNEKPYFNTVDAASDEHNGNFRTVQSGSFPSGAARYVIQVETDDGWKDVYTRGSHHPYVSDNRMVLEHNHVGIKIAEKIAVDNHRNRFKGV